MRFPVIRNYLVWGCMALLPLAAPAALASEDLDVTMRMVTDDEALTDSVVREIRLNRPIGLEKRPEGAGNNVASEAREAREKGREFGQAAAERAREARELREEARDAAKDAPVPGNPNADRPQPDR
jgi:hypothetical protein